MRSGLLIPGWFSFLDTSLPPPPLTPRPAPLRVVAYANEEGVGGLPADWLSSSEQQRGWTPEKSAQLSTIRSCAYIQLWGKRWVLLGPPCMEGRVGPACWWFGGPNEMMPGEPPQHKVWSTDLALHGERCSFPPLGCDTSLCQALVCFLLQTSGPGGVPPELGQMLWLCSGQQLWAASALLRSMECASLSSVPNGTPLVGT